MTQETFLTYKNYRWLLVASVFVLASIVVYCTDHPIGGRNGGTVVGYTLGILAALGIAWLMWFGIRKRSYASAKTPLIGWLSAHVWLGISLLIIVPLHAGMSFGINVHTLTYVLMVIVIVSGIWGAFNYKVVANQLESHRGGGTIKSLLEESQMLGKDLEALCLGKTDSFSLMVEQLDRREAPCLRLLCGLKRVPEIDRKRAAEMLTNLRESEREAGLRAIELIDRRSDLSKSALKEARTKALLRAWLFVHVPVSIALCVALIVHIVTVLYFR